MQRARIISLVAGATLLWASPVSAEPNWFIAKGKAVADTAFVSRSGQVFRWQKAALWQSANQGGLTADITAAGKLDGDRVVVAGKAAPLFVFDGGAWAAAPVGQKGKVILGTGPARSAAIGRQVFVWDNDKPVRVATTGSAITGVWASSKTNVRIATESGLLRVVGKKLVALALGGKGARLVPGNQLAVVETALVPLDGSKRTSLRASPSIVDASSARAAAVVGDQVVVVTLGKGATAGQLISYPLPTPSGTSSPGSGATGFVATGIAVFDDGDVVVASDEQVWLRHPNPDAVWERVELVSGPTQAKPGPGPAVSN